MTHPSAVQRAGTRIQMPFLLTCGMGFAMFFACVAIFVFIGFAVAMPFGGGSYSLDGHAVSREQFLTAAWPLLIVWPIAAAIIVGIAYALWKELPWSRAAILAYWLLVTAFTLAFAVWKGAREDVLSSGVMSIAVSAGLAWYLYGKRTVQTYYRAVAEQHARRRRHP